MIINRSVQTPDEFTIEQKVQGEDVTKLDISTITSLEAYCGMVLVVQVPALKSSVTYKFCDDEISNNKSHVHRNLVKDKYVPGQ